MNLCESWSNTNAILNIVVLSKIEATRCFYFLLVVHSRTFYNYIYISQKGIKNFDKKI